MKSMKQLASARLWDIISARANPMPVKVERPGKKEYSSKEYVSAEQRKASKESGGIPTTFLDAEERRKRAQVLRWKRQHGV